MPFWYWPLYFHVPAPFFSIESGSCSMDNLTFYAKPIDPKVVPGVSHNVPFINFVLNYLLMLGSYLLGNYLTALITLWAQVTLIGKDAYFEGNWCYCHSGVKGQSKAEGQCWGSFITICLWHIKSYVLWTLPLLIIIHYTYRNIFEYETSKWPIKKYGIEFQPCIKVVSLVLNSFSIL